MEAQEGNIGGGHGGESIKTSDLLWWWAIKIEGIGNWWYMNGNFIFIWRVGFCGGKMQRDYKQAWGGDNRGCEFREDWRPWLQWQHMRATKWNSITPWYFTWSPNFVLLHNFLRTSSEVRTYYFCSIIRILTLNCVQLIPNSFSVRIITSSCAPSWIHLVHCLEYYF